MDCKKELEEVLKLGFERSNPVIEEYTAYFWARENTVVYRYGTLLHKSGVFEYSKEKAEELTRI